MDFTPLSEIHQLNPICMYDLATSLHGVNLIKGEWKGWMVSPFSMNTIGGNLRNMNFEFSTHFINYLIDHSFPRTLYNETCRLNWVVILPTSHLSDTVHRIHEFRNESLAIDTFEWSQKDVSLILLVLNYHEIITLNVFKLKALPMRVSEWSRLTKTMISGSGNVLLRCVVTTLPEPGNEPHPKIRTFLRWLLPKIITSISQFLLWQRKDATNPAKDVTKTSEEICNERNSRDGDRPA